MLQNAHKERREVLEMEVLPVRTVSAVDHDRNSGTARLSGSTSLGMGCLDGSVIIIRASTGGQLLGSWILPAFNEDVFSMK